MNRWRVSSRVWLSLFFLGAALGLPGAARAATFTVLNTNDSGADSLRAAITAANAVAGPHTIQFNIPGAGPHLIGVLSALPDLVQTMTIDGYTQPGSSANTLPFNLGLNTVLKIGIDGSASVPISEGLTLAAPDVVIRGLAIYGFAGQIRVEQPRAVIAGNFLGTNITGTADASPSNFEVAIGGAAITGGDGSVIGGNAEADRNLISGHTTGISIEGRAVAIRYNLVGTDVTGNAAIPNEDGIFCRPDEEMIEVDRNLVSGNTNAGILALTFGTNGFCRVTRNYVGTNADASLPLGNDIGMGVGAGPHEIGGPFGNIVGGNADIGILIGGASGVRVSNNAIGTQPNVGSPDIGNGGAGIRVQASTNILIGDTFLEGNNFRFNGGAGISIASNSTGIRIGYARILENGGLGIDLDEDGVTPNDAGDADGGANLGQNFPEIVSAVADAGVTTISMELDGAVPGTYRIQLFSQFNCDPTRFGEGEFSREIQDVVADANGDASFQIVSAAELVGESVTAIATDPNGNTSEFSRCIPVANGLPVTEVPSLSTLGMRILAGFLIAAGLRKIAA